MVPNITFISLVAELLFVIIIPTVLLIVWQKKTKSRILSYVIGAASFFLFALVLEQISHTFCIVLDNPVSRAINNTPALFVAYGALAAGIFEETGRFISFKLFGKKIFTDKKNSVAYGIGHGGFEAIFLIGLTVVNMLIYAFMINSMGVEQFTLIAGEANKEALEATAQSLLSFSPASCLLAILERISAISLHISLSVLVYIAAKDKKKVWLYPVSILLHAAFDVAPAMYQIKLINSMAMVEGIIFAAALIFSVAAVIVYRKYSDAE